MRATTSDDERANLPAVIEAQVRRQERFGKASRPLQARADVLFEVEQSAPLQCAHRLYVRRLSPPHHYALLRGGGGTRRHVCVLGVDHFLLVSKSKHFPRTFPKKKQALPPDRAPLYLANFHIPYSFLYYYYYYYF